ncbi:MAG: hypothetical protein M1836_000813 [Candelina mexicana]|nr:MAG: hypothetical protein M1836_000813 [Candelina mexicana]
MYLLKNPATIQAAQKEVDTIIGKGPVTVDHMSKLPYITACLRETLRLQPTALAITIGPRPETDDPVFVGGGKYAIPQGATISALLPKVHRDPAVYGEDAEAFRPERMLDEKFNKLPKNAWKASASQLPFGNGVRACIGRPFAWQEALLATALLLQNFNFRLDDPSYKLVIKQTLTLKPKDFYMRATLRHGKDVVHLERSLYSGPSLEEKEASEIKDIKNPITNGQSKKPMSVFYGSNTGTCEALAQSLATAAASRGYDARVATLDSATDAVPKEEPVIIITASYEGEPPDNAAQFVQWLRNLQGDGLKGVQYAVFGCGHRDWQATFQKIPMLIDDVFDREGAKRIASRGYADAAAGDMFNDFDIWEDKTLWPAISTAFGGSNEMSDQTSGLDVEIMTQARPSNLRQDVQTAIVLDRRCLTGENEPPKRHIKFKLPTDMSYKPGDYLAVLPVNMSKNVRRVIKRFGLPWDAMITIKSKRSTQLPTDGPISVFDLLASYVELSQPATVKKLIVTKNIVAISKTVPADSSEHIELKRLSTDAFTTEITAKRVSPLDLLERFSTANLPLGEFLAMLPPLRIRQYSISSSPLADPTSCTLTWSVLDQESTAGDGKRFLGVASNYLGHLEKGEQAQVAVKPSHQAFHLPLAMENTPLVMVCAGTGIAPFRGFVQERALQIEAGRQLAPALLFIGCRNSSTDRVYADEFDHWEKLGAVKLQYAYSRESEKSEGCKYVQDRLWRERHEVTDLFDQGAKVFVCGNSAVGKAVEECAKKMYKEKAEANGRAKSEEEVEEWFRGIRNERFASDVFA